MKKLNHKRLAEGEVTGHFHAATARDAVLYSDDGVVPSFLEAPSGTEVTHQEHGTISLPPGDYDRSIVLEYDPFEEAAREVAD